METKMNMNNLEIGRNDSSYIIYCILRKVLFIYDGVFPVTSNERLFFARPELI